MQNRENTVREQLQELGKIQLKQVKDIKHSIQTIWGLNRTQH